VTENNNDTNGKAWLVLRRVTQTWGGPEEGGWYIRDSFVESAIEYASEDEAEAAREELQRTAKESTDAAKSRWEWFCRESVARDEARGIEPSDDYLDRPDKFVVCVETEEPADFINPTRHYC